MNRVFRVRYLFCARFDSQHLLKLLIGFNVFLGIYLLFLSTNYRHYSEYAHSARPETALPPPAHIQPAVSLPLSNSESNIELNAKAKANQQTPVEKPNVIPDMGNFNENDNAPAGSVAVKANKPSNADQLSVDKIYDANNKLVVQETDNGAPDGSQYKKVEEDDKTMDENDKLRIEMMGDKTGNSIIHDSEFSGEKPPPAAASPAGKEANKAPEDEESKAAKAAVVVKGQQDLENKDVVNRILDHNQHMPNQPNGGKQSLLVPGAQSNALGTSDTSDLVIPEIRGKYAVLRDYIPGTVAAQPPITLTSITLTTQGTVDFLKHIHPLVDRWEGFISVSVYAPGPDFRMAVNAIYYVRQCGTVGVSERVYWHLVYDTLYPPTTNVSGTFVPPPSAYLVNTKFDCNIPLEESLKLLNVASDFRTSHSLPYPINVLRNVARLGSKTKYIFASDIELYPSVGIVPAFFELLEREKNGLIPQVKAKGGNPHVYVVPIFEVKANKAPPRTKKELVKLFAARDAIFFHRYVCDLCQNFPDRALWVKSVPTNDSLNVFRITRRLHESSQWEPLYIGTNDEPFYDERLTWDGKRDKMTQMFEMCLKNYDLFILDNAFLVHAPGIKYYSVKDDAKRLPFIKANQKVHNLLLSQLRRKYGTKNKC